MKPKNLLPLVAILVVLAGLVYFKRSSETPASLTEQAQLRSLMPDGLEESGIAKLEFFAGDATETPVVLERASGEKWEIASHFGAPVAQDRVDDTLEALVGLQGEFRATASGDALSEYKLKDEQCFHIKGYAADSEEPLFHLLAGKAPKFGDAFARAAGSEDVYILNVNLRRNAGLYTVDLTDEPKPGPWLDKSLLDLEQDRIRRVALTYPDKELEFEYQKFETTVEPEANAEEGEEGEAAEPEVVEEWKWVVAKGGTSEALNETSLSNFTLRISGLNSSDVVDPDTPDEWGLNPPEYVARLGFDGEDEEFVVEVGRPKDSRDAYVRLPGAEKKLVYKISGYDFEQIFQEGGKYFELPGVLVDEDDVDAIEYTNGGVTYALSKGDEGWALTSPDTGLAVVQSEIDAVARTVLSWKATDYADSAEGVGFDAPAGVVSISGEGVSHTISVGGASVSGTGFYARLDDIDQVLVDRKSVV